MSSFLQVILFLFINYKKIIFYFSEMFKIFNYFQLIIKNKKRIIDKMKVNIWKLPRRVSERELEKRLSEYGRLFSFQFYGSYAIAEFRHRRDAERAIRKLNDSYFDGTRIRVDECKKF